MSEAVIRIVIAGAGVVVGLAAGLGLSPALFAPAPTSEAPAAIDAPDPSTTASPRGSLVCASGPSGVQDLQARWCHAQLAEHSRRAQMVRTEWPEDLGQEAPEAWTAALEAAMADCDLPFALQTVECTEYPCMATVRSSGSVPEGGWDSWQPVDCPALEAFQNVGVQPSRVRCPDGRLEDVLVLYGYDTATLEYVVGPRVADDGTGDPVADLAESFRLLGRRLDDVVTTHGCGGGEG